jgi:hypothetical protein
MLTTQFLLLVNDHAIETYPTRLQAVAAAWGAGYTNYEVVRVLVADLRGGFPARKHEEAA